VAGVSAYRVMDYRLVELNRDVFVVELDFATKEGPILTLKRPFVIQEGKVHAMYQAGIHNAIRDNVWALVGNLRAPLNRSFGPSHGRSITATKLLGKEQLLDGFNEYNSVNGENYNQTVFSQLEGVRRVLAGTILAYEATVTDAQGNTVQVQQGVLGYGEWQDLRNIL